MSRRRVPRRLFLSALGACLAGYPSTQAAPAGPQSTTTGGPLRFIGAYTPHGAAYELFTPGPGFDIGYENCSLAPFDDPARFGKSFKPYLTVVDHIDLSAGIEVGTVGHDAARVILTGSGAHGKNASVDQYLAVEQGLGRETPFSSLNLSVGHAGSDLGLNISYASGGTPLPKLIDPAQAFDDLFGTPLTGKARLELEHDRRKRLSVLDFLKHDLEQLRGSAGGAERIKLEQHQSALREIEKRLTRVRTECAPPLQRAATNFTKLRAYGGGEKNFDAITDVMIDVLARALACDLSRFSTIFLADLSRTKLFSQLPEDIHGAVAHRYLARTEKRGGDPATWLPLAVQNRYTYSKLARLMQRLDEAGILDDCLIYASSDMGDPALHSSRHVPSLLLGGAGGRLKMGRYLELDPEKGTPNNRILVSICQAFGLGTTRFGTASNGHTLTGRLEELHA